MKLLDYVDNELYGYVMKVDKLFFKIASFLNIAFWGASGLIVLFSNFYGFSLVNYVIGILFVSVALFLFVKYKNFYTLHFELTKDEVLNKKVERVVRDEYIFIILSGLLSFMLLMGSSSRVFGEHMSVFG